MMKELLYTINFFLFSFFSLAQTDSSGVWIKRICVTGGVCNTLPTSYLGASGALLVSTKETKNWMLQTGIEYVSARYNVGNINSISTSHGFGATYSNMLLKVNTITIPFYFNCFLTDRNLYIGVGPHFDIMPNSLQSYSGYEVTYGPNGPSLLLKTDGTGDFLKKVGFGVSCKLGYFIMIKNQGFSIELKYKYGISNLINTSQYSGSINHNYFTLNIGYVLKSNF